MTTLHPAISTLEETEYLDQLATFSPDPYVDDDARWGLTVAGVKAIGATCFTDLYPDNRPELDGLAASWSPWGTWSVHPDELTGDHR